MGHYAPVVSIRDLAVPPVPGFFYTQYNAYCPDRVDGDGNKRLNFESEGGQVKLDTDDVLAIAPVFIWSTSKKILGATYAFYIAPTLGKSSVSAQLSIWIRSARPTMTPSALVIPMSSRFGWGGRVTAMTLPWAPGHTCPRVSTTRKTATVLVWDFGPGKSRARHTGTWTRRGPQPGVRCHLRISWRTGRYRHHAGDHVRRVRLQPVPEQRFEVGISGYSQWQVEQDKRPMLTGLGLDPNAKGEVHAIGGGGLLVHASFQHVTALHQGVRGQGAPPGRVDCPQLI